MPCMQSLAGDCIGNGSGTSKECASCGGGSLVDR
jgi:hypothetical protein